ncbi:DUF4349 domain-containing protein [Luteimonas sp. SX5]|uniref:DUF4349 domain-containing protein n=1 Tax=Luteimonas galliterrae TaxID=2940486 RepID=A0ABT0MLW0_9GAMM|nr:DUF4349 domain-containing protein [Luteimonas galliterrae]MCL1635871.1 DUF4349 domain-containing protein [Luteimonas galliterrae]
MHRNSRTGLALAVAIALALAACSRNAPQAESAADADAMVAAQATAAAPAPAPALDAAARGGVAAEETQSGIDESKPNPQQLISAASTYTDAQRKFIRTAQAEFKVADVYRSALAIEDAVAAQGGFVVKNAISAQTGDVRRRPMGEGKLLELTEYTMRGQLTVRVPSDKTQAFLRAIVGQMEFLDRREFDAMDAQFQLLRQQLAHQRGQETQRDLGAATEQGGKLGHKAEAIAARSDAKLARDEALVAQKEFEDRIAFSTIDLSLYQSPKIRRAELTDVEAVFDQNSPGFFARIGSSLRVGWHGALNLLVELAKLWPLWLAAIAATLAYRRYSKGRRVSAGQEKK